jgi:hypothetical protein
VSSPSVGGSGSSGLGSTSSMANGGSEEDRGLIMREREAKDRDRVAAVAASDECSTGKAGGVGVGVTRPKRRLSR